ncbi:hypothetical protein IAU59_000302 [Kwoniella sp. CBS 9459]
MALMRLRWTEAQLCKLLDHIAFNKTYRQELFPAPGTSRSSLYHHIERTVCTVVLDGTEWMRWMESHELVQRNLQGQPCPTALWLGGSPNPVSSKLKWLEGKALDLCGTLGPVKSPSQLMGTSAACNMWKQWQERGEYTWYFRWLDLKLASDPEWIDRHTAQQQQQKQRPLAARFTSTISTSTSSRSRSPVNRLTQDKGKDKGCDRLGTEDGPNSQTRSCAYGDLTRGRPDNLRSHTDSSINSSRGLRSRMTSSDNARSRHGSYHAEASRDSNARACSDASRSSGGPYRATRSHEAPSAPRGSRRSASPDWAAYYARTRGRVPGDRSRSPGRRVASTSGHQRSSSRNLSAKSSGSSMSYDSNNRQSSTEATTPRIASTGAKSLSERLRQRDIINLVSDSDHSDDDIVYVGRKSPEAWSPLPARSVSPLDAPHIPSPARHVHVHAHARAHEHSHRRGLGRQCASDVPYDERTNLQRLRSNDFSGPLIKPLTGIEVDDIRSEYSPYPATPPPLSPPTEPIGVIQTFGQISPHFMPNMFRDDTIRSHRLDALHRNLGLPPVHPQPEPEAVIMSDSDENGTETAMDQLVYSPLIISDCLQFDPHPPWQSFFSDEAIVISDEASVHVSASDQALSSETMMGSQQVLMDIDPVLSNSEDLTSTLEDTTPMGVDTSAKERLGEPVSPGSNLNSKERSDSEITFHDRERKRSTDYRPRTPPLPGKSAYPIPPTPPTPVGGFEPIDQEIRTILPRDMCRGSATTPHKEGGHTDVDARVDMSPLQSTSGVRPLKTANGTPHQTPYKPVVTSDKKTKKGKKRSSNSALSAASVTAPPALIEKPALSQSLQSPPFPVLDQSSASTSPTPPASCTGLVTGPATPRPNSTSTEAPYTTRSVPSPRPDPEPNQTSQPAPPLRLPLRQVHNSTVEIASGMIRMLLLEIRHRPSTCLRGVSIVLKLGLLPFRSTLIDLVQLMGGEIRDLSLGDPTEPISSITNHGVKQYLIHDGPMPSGGALDMTLFAGQEVIDLLGLLDIVMARRTRELDLVNMMEAIPA